jgi:hypothetical protein
VHEQSHLDALQEADEFTKRPCAMTDRVERMRHPQDLPLRLRTPIKLPFRLFCRSIGVDPSPRQRSSVNLVRTAAAVLQQLQLCKAPKSARAAGGDSPAYTSTGITAAVH